MAQADFNNPFIERSARNGRTANDLAKYAIQQRCVTAPFDLAAFGFETSRRMKRPLRWPLKAEHP